MLSFGDDAILDKDVKNTRDVQWPHIKKVRLEKINSPISKNRKTESVLPLRDNIWENTFDSISDWIIITDINGRIIKTNKAGEKFTGIPSEEIVGKSCCKLIHGSTKQLPGCPMRQMIQTGQRTTVELFLPNGKWVNITVEPVKDEDGKIKSVIRIIRDITDKKTTENMLIDSQKLYFQLFENNLNAVLLTVPDGGIIAANPAACRLFGRTEDEIKQIGRNGLVDLTDPRFTKAIEKRKCTGKFHGELNFVRKDGTKFEGEISSVVFNDKDGNTRTCMTIQDITEREKVEKALEESEIRYHELFEHMPSGVAVYEVIDGGKDFIFKDFNRAGERYDEQSREELIGKSIFDARPGVEEFGLIDAFRKVIKSGKPVNHPVKLYKDNRLTAWYDNYIYLLPSGKLVAVFDNVTDKKKAEQALLDSKEKYYGMIKNLLEGFYVCSLEGKLLEYNYEFVRILRLDPKKDHTGTYLPNFWQNPDARKAYIKELLQEGFIKNHIIYSRTMDGKEIVVQVNSRLIKGKNPELSRIEGTFLDITKHKRIEEALQESQETLKTILDTVPAMIWLKDTEGRYIWNNRFHAYSIGIQENMAAGKTDFDIFPKEQAEKFQKDDNEIVSTLKPKLAIIESYQKPKGKIGWIRMSKLPLFNKSDQIIGTIGFALDITETKLAQDALSVNDQLLNEVGRIAKIGGWEMDLITRKAKWTKGTYDIVEIVEGEPIPGYDEHLGYYLPEYRPVVEQAMKKLIEEDIPLEFEAKLWTAKGNIKWIRAIGRAVRKNGICLKLFGTLQDITDYKRAQEAINYNRHLLEEQMYLSKTLLDAIPCVALLLRPETLEIVASNKAAVEVGAIPGKTCYGTWAKRTEPCPWCLAPKVCKEGQSQHLEVEYKGIVWDAYWIAVSDDLYIHFVFDITERKKIEANVLEYQKQLKSLASQLTLTEEKERYRIAMELHDQVGQYLAVSVIKLMELLDSAVSEETKIIIRQINDWLRNAIKQTRLLTSDYSSLILQELGFEQAVEAWLQEEIQKKHKIKTEFLSDGIPKHLDDDILLLLFRNVRELLFNVVKHAHAKWVKVSVATVENNIYIQVEDDGVGFDSAKVAATVAGKSRFGLFSVRERLEQFGGHMEVDSAPGKGCRVTLIAPLKNN